MKHFIAVLLLGCASTDFEIGSDENDGAFNATFDAAQLRLDTDVTETSGADTAVTKQDTGPTDTGPDTATVADTTTDPLDSAGAVDTATPDTSPKFASTPGYVACSGPSDVCEKSAGERCCFDGPKPDCRPSSAPTCDFTKTYACDEAADCGGSRCCLWPSGGSQCTCTDGAVQLCMTDGECLSGVCEPYSAWPGHGRCKSL